MQEKLKRKMMEKFRDGEVARLQKIVNSGKVIGAELLVSDTVEKLRAKVALCEAQRDGHKVLDLTSVQKGDFCGANVLIIP